MEPEKDTGNVEYKLKLINKDFSRVESLVSQMRYRCDEGGGECIYNIGVADDGEMIGITDEEYKETINTLTTIAGKNNYSIQILSSVNISSSLELKIYEVLIREINDTKYIDIKIAICGHVDAGKSSTLASFITGKLDNGRGESRLSIFNYPHEVKTGRTSSIAQHIMGFDKNGDIVNYKDFGRKTWPEIVRESSKIISFYDLAGHEKYLKTTITGLSSSFPDFSFVIVGGNKGIQKMTVEHIFICITLKIPFIIIITKIDMKAQLKDIFDKTMNDIKSILRRPAIRKIPVKVSTTEDVILCSKNISSESIVPIFSISNITGEGLDNLRKFLNLVSKKSKNLNNKVEYFIDNIWNVKGVGIVVGGQLISGTIKIGDKLFLGPNSDEYATVQVKSIHCKKVPLQIVNTSSYVCLALRNINREDIRCGNVIMSLTSPKVFCKNFKANISVLRTHSTTIRYGYEPIMHANSLRQTVKIIKIENKHNSRNKDDIVEDYLRTGDKADVTFEFKYFSEYITVGTRILLCEGLTKVIGTVIEVL